MAAGRGHPSDTFRGGLANMLFLDADARNGASLHAKSCVLRSYGPRNARGCVASPSSARSGVRFGH